MRKAIAVLAVVIGITFTVPVQKSNAGGISLSLSPEIGLVNYSLKDFGDSLTAWGGMEKGHNFLEFGGSAKLRVGLTEDFGIYGKMGGAYASKTNPVYKTESYSNAYYSEEVAITGDVKFTMLNANLSVGVSQHISALLPEGLEAHGEFRAGAALSKIALDDQITYTVDYEGTIYTNTYVEQWKISGIGFNWAVSCGGEFYLTKILFFGIDGEYHGGTISELTTESYLIDGAAVPNGPTGPVKYSSGENATLGLSGFAIKGKLGVRF
ncbi:hypothetical protein HY768_04885 [candidate division TA06 bacterium]|uniref:Uncharacterized protein n=1 Tax=candidate division TA06 bacterium TaxID=2250710 RepID=A0A933IDN6_UNCT6|nr:hypothetical protein [candidate division TA06 bacterium]